MADKVVSILEKVNSAKNELSNREVVQNVFDKLSQEVAAEIGMLSAKDKATLWIQMAKLLTPNAPAEDQRQVLKGAEQDDKISKLYRKAQ